MTAVLDGMRTDGLSQHDEIADSQSGFEKLDLSDCGFPRAGKLNHLVLENVETLMTEWRKGGAEKSQARTLLNSLYKATTQTFNSQRILRHLVDVHTVLGEYVEAELATATYLKIVDKAKETNAKAQKMAKEKESDPSKNEIQKDPSKHLVLDMDSDADIVQTLLIASRICAKYIQNGTKALFYASQALQHAQGTSADNDKKLMSQAYCAIGCANSVRGYEDFNPVTRPKFQQDALTAFSKAVNLNPQSIHAQYHLAYQYAELRKIGSALQACRTALDLDTTHAPSWQLLIHLVGAQKDYARALKLCDVALDEVETENEDSSRDNATDATSSSKINLSTVPIRGETGEIVLRLRMTRALLIEALEGQEEAIQAHQTLFYLFSQVYGDAVVITQSYSIPPTRAGTYQKSSSQASFIGHNPINGNSAFNGTGSITVSSQDHYGLGNLEVPQSNYTGPRRESLSSVQRSITPEPRDLANTVIASTGIIRSNEISNSRFGKSGAPSLTGTVTTTVHRATPSNPVAFSGVGSPNSIEPLGDRIRRMRALNALVDLWLLSASTFRRWGKQDDAKTAIQEAEIVDGTNPSVWIAYGLYLLEETDDEEKNGQLAIKSLHKALSLDARNVPASVFLAKTYLDLDKPDKSYLELAEGLLESITKGNGWDCPMAWLQLGRVCERTNREDRARECYWYAAELEETQGIESLDRCLRVL